MYMEKTLVIRKMYNVITFLGHGYNDNMNVLLVYSKYVQNLKYQ